MRLSLIAVLLLAPAFCSNADLVVVEDFSSLTPGSIDMQHEIIEQGTAVEMWNVQQDSTLRGDHGGSVIETGEDGAYLRLSNLDINNQVSSVYTSLYLGQSNAIWNQGTIYLTFMTNGLVDCTLATNDLLPGYLSDVPGEYIGEDIFYQGLGNHGAMGMLCMLTSEVPLRIYDDYYRGYRNVDMGLVRDTWYELLIHLDCPNTRSSFQVRQLGKTETQIAVNPATGDQWWYWRNQTHTNSGVVNLKWLHGAFDGTQRNVCIGLICIDNEKFCDWPQAASAMRGDVNHDGFINSEDIDLVSAAIGQPYDSSFDLNSDDEVSLLDREYLVFDILGVRYGDANLDYNVNLDDFIILKQNYGFSPVGWAQGDFNGDATVGLDDFILLKQNYGL